MAETLTPDICVIGGGPGAAAVAMAAAAFGVPVVLVERRADETCGNLPALVAAARRAALTRGSAPFGVNVASADVDFAKVREHVRQVAAALAPNESTARLAGMGVRVIAGEGRFKDRRTFAVGDCDIRARRFVIAAAPALAPPQIPGLDPGTYFTAETIFTLAELPRQLIVIGAGPAGLELAQAFRRLDSEVTVLGPGQPLVSEDEECAAIVLDQLEREGVVIRSGVKIARIEHAGGGVQAILEGIEGDDSVAATHLLVAAENSPSFGGLNLEAAGITSGDAGIQVNEKLKTSNKRVYAIGAAIGQQRAAHHQAGLVIRSALFRARIKTSRETVARVTLTDPELAQVGVTESEARRRGLAIRIARWPYHDNARAAAERCTRGHIKIVTTAKGIVLGTTIVGAQAGEMIGAWALAIAQRLNISVFADLSLPPETLAEIGNKAALDFFAPRLTSPWVRRIIAWMRIFG
ncbi:MAG TPA: FAD-dependent oxidoreductase [Steroidobacteraceae bacterium]|jgi:pyruvate/2-oxoglutarate dehydrogenase complex dihydrolipoamide dehydrogenase (E3) component|nr:FAD-dependent oxidoreductase [Steroidobacteraceae bacterium]